MFAVVWLAAAAVLSPRLVAPAGGEAARIARARLGSALAAGRESMPQHRERRERCRDNVQITHWHVDPGPRYIAVYNSRANLNPVSHSVLVPAHSVD